MKAIVVTDQTAGTAEMKLAQRPNPQAAINDVIVEVHAAGFVNTEFAGLRPGPIASGVTGDRRFPGTSWQA